MTKHDESRRAFLVGTVAGAVATTTTLVPEAKAQHDATVAQAHTHEGGEKLGAFLNQDDSAAIEAFAERLMPGAPGKPGAKDAGVLNYIDLALAGAYSSQQDFYRRGCAALEAHCQAAHKKPFAQLAAADQDAVITAMEQGKVPAFTWPSAQAFFNTLRTHTIEGMFSDPVYGGNKDFAGWRLVGFPGTQAAFTEADMKSKEAFTRLPITGLQGKART